MDLNILWFGLVAVLFIGYFFLEGFDFGVGMLLPFIAKDDQSRRRVINAIGPFWDGNEVWLLTAGGALFAAFPNWYATLFSGFYLALFLMLVGLIVRAVAFEYRSKDDRPGWRNFWDWMIFTGSAIPALLWGVAFANIVRGVPIDQEMTYVGGFFNLLNPYALLGGIASVSIFLLHGALFLNLKTTDDLQRTSKSIAFFMSVCVISLLGLLTLYSNFATDLFTQLQLGIIPVITTLVGALTIGATIFLIWKSRTGWAFIMTGVAIASIVMTIFTGLYPRVMISSLNPEWSLTIYNASSSQYTLGIMSIVALIFVPIVLVYQSWTYWIFKKRITPDSVLEY